MDDMLISLESSGNLAVTGRRCNGSEDTHCGEADILQARF